MQASWRSLAAGEGAERECDGALLLRVIARAAGRFPHKEAAALAKELLKAGTSQLAQYYHSPMRLACVRQSLL